ncbi:MAG TPA: hypothetical protein VNK03_04670 [Gammaproteobacteria bacterium]|nr:hypothetical protein [Gammaproteobacteria bacterium]
MMETTERTKQEGKEHKSGGAASHALNIPSPPRSLTLSRIPSDSPSRFPTYTSYFNLYNYLPAASPRAAREEQLREETRLLQEQIERQQKEFEELKQAEEARRQAEEARRQAEEERQHAQQQGLEETKQRLAALEAKAAVEAEQRQREKTARRAIKESVVRQQEEAAASPPPVYTPQSPPLRSATLSPHNKQRLDAQAQNPQFTIHLSPIEPLVPSQSAPASTNSPIPSTPESNAQPSQLLPDSPVEHKLAADVVASGAPAEWEPEQTSDEPNLEEGTAVETARHSPTGSASQVPVVEQKLAQEGVSTHLPSGTGSEETGGPTAEEPCEEAAIEAAVHSSTGDSEQKILEEGAAQQQMQHITLLVTLQQQEAIRTQLAEQRELKAAAEEAVRQAADQERIRQEAARQAAEQERTRKETEEARLTALRLQQAQEAQRVILLQQQAAITRLQEEQERQRTAEAQAAEERRRAEAAFAASCATGAPTLEKHYEIAKALVISSGF